MKINQSNYEIFFLDYLDGKLSLEQVDEFLDFLKNNPALQEELKSIEGMKLPLEKYSFPGKEELLRDEDGDNHSFDYRAVAFMEGDLSGEDQKSFLREMEADSQKEKEFDLLLETKLKNEDIRIPDKENLYRKSSKVHFLYWIGRVAAVIVLLMVVWTLNRYDHTIEQKPFFSESLSPGIQSEKDELTEKQEPIKKQESLEKLKKTINDSIPKKKESIREKTKGRLKEVALLSPENRESVPAIIKPIVALVNVETDPMLFALKTTTYLPDSMKNMPMSVDEYLAYKLFNKKKDQPADLNKLTTASLEKVSSLSNEKFSYQTNVKGKVSGINLNTRLLAFSIPIRKNK